MDCNRIIDKLIEKTNSEKLKWEKTNSIPDCITITPHNTTKIFYTEINDKMTFYLIEYSYYSYSPETDSNYLEYTIRGTFIQENIEVDSFERFELITPSRMNELMDLIIKKFFDTEQQFDDFLNT